MKKLLFIALFSFGLFSVSNAQFVFYTATNSGVDKWDLGMTSAGTPIPVLESGILPSEVRNGLINGFAFPFKFKAGNQNGCGDGAIIPAVTGGVFLPISCSVPTALKYRFEELIPFVLWEFEVKFG